MSDFNIHAPSGWLELRNEKNKKAARPCCFNTLISLNLKLK